jgi:protein-disulfide isomerase
MVSKSTLVYSAVALVIVLGAVWLLTRPAVIPDAGTITVGNFTAFESDAGRAVRGSKTATVHLVEFSDFQCPFCRQNADSIEQVLTAYPTQVSVEYRDFPLVNVHPYAEKGAEAFECANEQGAVKAWAMHDAMFQKQVGMEAYAGDVPRVVLQLKSFARSVGLNGPAFDTCLDSGKKADLVARDEALGVKLGVQSTPTVFIEGTPVVGANPFSTYKNLIDAKLGA